METWNRRLKVWLFSWLPCNQFTLCSPQCGRTYSTKNGIWSLLTDWLYWVSYVHIYELYFFLFMYSVSNLRYVWKLLCSPTISSKDYRHWWSEKSQVVPWLEDVVRFLLKLKRTIKWKDLDIAPRHLIFLIFKSNEFRNKHMFIYILYPYN